MSYPPNKRQRSNTSIDHVNSTPQTQPPALRQAAHHQQQQQQQQQHPQHQHQHQQRQHPHQHQHQHHQHQHQVASTLGPYSPTAYTNGGTYAAQATAQQTVSYASYSPNPVAAQSNGYGGAYQGNSTVYGAAPYSPQPQLNSYTTQYTQSQPTEHIQPHAVAAAAAAYSHARTNGLHNGGAYAQARTPSLDARTTYSPVHANHQTTTAYQSNTPTLQHSQQLQHSLPQYSESFSSHPSPHAPSFHSSSASYADTVIGSQYSPAPLPTPLNETRNVSEDIQEDDSEDAQGETADESTELYPNAEPAKPSLPTPSIDVPKSPENKCACKKGRGKKKACISCVCSKYGLNCTSSCACGNACGNPFADLTPFFGTKGAFPKPCGPNACFATWLSNQPNIEELDMDLMVDMLLYDDTSWATIREYTSPFKKWEDSWKKARGGKGKKNREERERLEFELLRGGLGNCNQNDFNGYWYSFCESKWVPMDHWEHCPECRICRESSEWHCDKHDKCTTNRVCAECAAAPYGDTMSYTKATG
ncbi:hypothetical protein F4778DRAFT_759702 [Xylariomycetidae sp. FL2044]|nr:hypothetical protein F4778DRAFT_759702 [Xylariomycetidae sp. FL2044]